MHRLALLPLLALLSATLSAGDAAVIGTWAVHDGEQLRAHWRSTPYFKIWSLPQLAPARAGLGQILQASGMDLGSEPLALLEAMAAAHGDSVADPESTGGTSNRVELRLSASTAALWQALSARGSSDAEGLLHVKDVTARRDGDVLRFAGGSATPQPLTAITRLAPWADYSSRFDLMALRLPEGQQATFDAVCRIFHLGELTLAIGLGPDGLRDQVDVGPATLPVRALDRRLLDLVPGTALEVMALGIDGSALQRSADALALGIPDLATAMHESSETLATAGLPPLKDILRGLDGTILVILAQGAPFPTVTLALPRSASTDALVAAWATSLDLDLAGVDQAAIPIPMPEGGAVPILPVLRQDAAYWFLSTDTQLPDQMAAGSAGGFASTKLFAQAGSSTVAGLMTMDLPGLARMGVSYLPLAMAGARLPEQKQMLKLVQQGLAAAIPLLPQGHSLLLTGARTQIVGRNGSMAVLPIMAGVLLPAITMVREQARRSQSGNNLRQLLLASAVYSNESDGQWPSDLDMLIEYHNGELTRKILISPLDRSNPAPYLYVRPVPAALATQPVIIEDPATSRGKGCMVAFADGHTAWFAKDKAARLWAEAQRLAALPEAAETGITPDDWDAVADLLK